MCQTDILSRDPRGKFHFTMYGYYESYSQCNSLYPNLRPLSNVVYLPYVVTIFVQDVERPFSLCVTSVRISGHGVNRTTPPPYPFTEGEWEYWDHNFNVTAEVTYTVTLPSHCNPDMRNPSRYNCKWPNIVPNIVMHVSKGTVIKTVLVTK